MNQQKSSAAESAVSQINPQPLVVVGTVAVDSITTPFGSREQVFGGSASYFSYAASFFTPVSLVGVVGKDFPDEYRRILQERAIDLSHLETVDGKTFSWKGSYESDMNSAHTLETHLNVLAQFKPKLNFTGAPSFLFLANIDPDLQMNVLDQLHKPKLKLVASDTMNFWIASKKERLIEVLARVDCIVLNDGEARQLTGEVNLVRAGQRIREMGPAYVVIKKGEHGVLVFSKQQFFALPAYPLESVFDPTGAGDSFAGGMIGYLASTGDATFENIKRAAAYGTIVASFAVEDFGLDGLRRIRLEDIQSRLELFRELVTF